MEQHFDQHFTNTEQRLTALEETYHDLSVTVSLLTESPPSPVVSSPSVMQEVLETIIDTKFQATYQASLDSFIHLSAFVVKLHLQHSASQVSSLSTPRPTGFFQKKSKDFHVSHLMKLLEQEFLHSDSLQYLDILFESILSHFNTVALTTELYPRYCDLP